MSHDAFRIQLQWQPQANAFTYNDYSRQYTINSAGKPQLIGTAAPAYKGSDDQYNPEDMLIASLSACHMLTYLALAANAKLEVLAYQDNAEGSLHTEAGATKFKEVILKPRITISVGSDKERALALHEKAHKVCFISNSINFPVKVIPEIVQG